MFSTMNSRVIGGLRRFPKAFVTIGGAQSMSISSTEAKPERISKNLSFRPAYDSHLDEASRPIVLVYGWLVAKAKHIHKYGDFYLGKGFDVLHIKIDPTQLLWPRRGQRAVQQLIDFIDGDVHNRRPILVHGFSVGGYLYGETLVKILSNSEKYASLGERIQGQIFDSPVDMEGVPRGFSQAVTPVPVLQKLLQNSIEAHLKITKPYTTKHFMASSAAFHENQLQVPSLIFYSTSDPIGIPGPIETVMGKWEKKDIPVYSKCWPDTRHVSHFHRHPVEYIQLLNYFLEQIGLLEEQSRYFKKASRIES